MVSLMENFFTFVNQKCGLNFIYAKEKEYVFLATVDKGKISVLLKQMEE